jgi:hypothetical protein
VDEDLIEGWFTDPFGRHEALTMIRPMNPPPVSQRGSLRPEGRTRRGGPMMLNGPNHSTLNRRREELGTWSLTNRVVSYEAFECAPPRR